MNNLSVDTSMLNMVLCINGEVKSTIFFNSELNVCFGIMLHILITNTTIKLLKLLSNTFYTHT